MSELRTNRIIPRDGLPAGSSGGGIIQVVSVTKTDAESLISNATETLIPGMQATITPQSASNKILVMLVLYAQVGGSFAGQYAVLKRGSTNIAVGDAAGSRNRASISLQAPMFYEDSNTNNYGPAQASINHLDSPGTTGAVTYGLYHADVSSDNNLYINRAVTDTDSGLFNRLISSITLMEITG
jgi:hypothetical protein